MTLNREELEQLKMLFSKICDRQEDCQSCPLGITSKKGITSCLEDRILERVEARVDWKEKQANE